jgi:hypothetical protein
MINRCLIVEDLRVSPVGLQNWHSRAKLAGHRRISAVLQIKKSALANAIPCLIFPCNSDPATRLTPCGICCA